jgi:uncharacterized protein YecE (DUF72 family)
MAKRGRLHIGTSGWHYKHWVGPFYPEGTRPSAMLDTYAGRLSALEINNSFYRLLSPKALEQWRAATPDDFVFFDNDAEGNAPRDALRLLKRLEQD